MHQLWKVMVVMLTGLLLACGADLSSGTGSGLVLRASATGIKSITFQWSTVAGATHYKLFVDPDGSSGFTQVGSDLTTTSMVVPIPVHLTNWLNARYLVEAHNAGGLIATSSSTGIDSLMLDVIGYAKASNTGFGDNFGNRVAVSGDGNTLAVSAIGEDSSATGINGDGTDNNTVDSGAVYLFIRSGQTWVQQAYIKSPNPVTGDMFGGSVALSSNGNTLAVGATGEDGVIGNSGAVFIFAREGTTWSQQAYIKSPSPVMGDLFGGSVSLSSDGNTLAAAATGEDGVTGDSGAVFLFTRTVTTWSQQAYIKSSNPDTGDIFGGSVALSSDGNILAVGAAGEDSAATGIDGSQSDNSASNAGAVYLFTRSGTAWSQQAYIKASNTDISNPGDAFGGSLALSGDGNTLVVGAAGEDSGAIGIDGSQSDNSAINAGAVYLFTRSGTAWSQQAYIKASNTDILNPGDAFGSSLALSGDGNTLAVGATGEDSASTGIDGSQSNDPFANNSGAVYLFTRSAGVWGVHSYVKAPNTDPFVSFGDNFGSSLALSIDGNTLMVGAPYEDSDAMGINGDMTNNNLIDAGAAYIY